MLCFVVQSGTLLVNPTLVSIKMVVLLWWISDILSLSGEMALLVSLARTVLWI